MLTKKMTISLSFFFLALIFISQRGVADTPAILPEHMYALSFSKSNSLATKNMVPEIANSPLNYPEKSRLFAAYYYAGLLTGPDQKGHALCPTSLKILSKHFDSNLEAAAVLIRFYCFSKANQVDAAIKELKLALKYTEIPLGQSIFADDAMRCLKDLKLTRVKDYILVIATYANLPFIDMRELIKLIPSLVEKNKLTYNEGLNIGKAIEAGAKKDFANNNESTWLARSFGLRLQRNLSPYCPDGVIACKDTEIRLRKKFATIDEERTANAHLVKSTDFTRLLIEAEASGDMIAWVNNSKEHQDRFIKAVEKEPLWNEYLKFK